MTDTCKDVTLDPTVVALAECFIAAARAIEAAAAVLDGRALSALTAVLAEVNYAATELCLVTALADAIRVLTAEGAGE
ncbi:MAG: hypothetical protein QM621_14930 [Aeromicrobium sp.]|uniref:hypothetical protein n=1 Tax=Aeromicrobium sp. TaxID=1871063 RepID=UPI0039E314D3